MAASGGGKRIEIPKGQKSGGKKFLAYFSGVLKCERMTFDQLSQICGRSLLVSNDFTFGVRPSIVDIENVNK